MDESFEMVDENSSEDEIIGTLSSSQTHLQPISTTTTSPTPKFYILGVSCLVGFISGSLIPRFGKPVLLYTASSLVTIPVLRHYGLLEVTEKGKNVVGMVREWGTMEKVDEVKEKGVVLLRKNFLTGLVFMGGFLFALNRYYSSNQ